MAHDDTMQLRGWLARRPTGATGQLRTANASHRIAGLAAVYAAVAVANVALVGPALGLTSGSGRLHPAVLAAMFFASEIWIVHFPFRRQAHTFSLSEIPLVLGLLLAGPWEVMGAQAIGAGAAMFLWRRQHPLKVGYNLAHFALATSVAWLILQFVHTQAQPYSAWGLAGALAAVVAAAAIQSAAVSLAIALTGDPMTRERLTESAAFSLVTAVANGSLALILMVLIDDASSSVPFLAIGPAALLSVAYVGYANQREAAARLAVLYDTTTALQRTRGLEGLVHGLLRTAREQLRADRAELRLLDDEADSIAARIDPDGTFTIVGSDDEGPSALLRHAVELQGAILQPRDVAGPLREYTRLRGWRDAVAVPLRGEHHVIGSVVVADRHSDIDTFDAQDLDLLEALAGTAATLVERHRLGESLHDVTEMKRHLTHALSTDGLTGLRNRRAFIEQVDDPAARGHQRAVAVVHLDGIADINVGRGADVADTVIVAAARRLAGVLRPTDVLAHAGGGCFAVLLPHVPDLDVVHGLLSLVRTSLRRPYDVGDISLVLAPRIGLAVDPPGTETAAALLARADAARRLHRQEPDTSYRAYRAELQDAAARRIEEAAALQEAIRTGEGLHNLYQPIVDLGPGRIVGFEALARWEHRALGSIPPRRFLETAARADLTSELGNRLLTLAIDHAATWQQLTGPERRLGLTVNLSAGQLTDPGLLAHLDRTLRAAGFTHDQLTVDLDTATVSTHLAQVRLPLEQLSRFGVRIALDDVSSSGHLPQLLSEIPVDAIKLPRALVGKLRESPAARAVAHALFDLAAELDVAVVAEGLEDHGDLDAIRELGTPFAQGYLVAPPLDADGVARLLRAEPVGVSDPGNVIHLHERGVV